MTEALPPFWRPHYPEDLIQVELQFVLKIRAEGSGRGSYFPIGDAECKPPENFPRSNTWTGCEDDRKAIQTAARLRLNLPLNGGQCQRIVSRSSRYHTHCSPDFTLTNVLHIGIS